MFGFYLIKPNRALLTPHPRSSPCGVYWASYEAWKGFYARRGREGAFVAFLSGASSGILAALVTSPFDVLKTRRQTLLMSESTLPQTRIIPMAVQRRNVELLGDDCLWYMRRTHRSCERGRETRMLKLQTNWTRPSTDGTVSDRHCRH